MKNLIYIALGMGFISLQLGVRPAWAENYAPSDFENSIPNNEITVGYPNGHSGAAPSFDLTAVSAVTSYINSDSTFFGVGEKTPTQSLIGARATINHANFAVDAKWFYVNQERAQYFDVPELSGRPVKNLNLQVGRHRETWSSADEFWQQGYWQPQLQWDRMHPSSQGLTGAFYTMTGEAARLVLFASPIFIPNMGPQYQQKNGEVTSPNPWFRDPPKTVQLMGQDVQASTEIHNPDTWDVVLRPSVGFLSEYQSTSAVLWRASYAYKPINAAVFAIAPTIQLTPTQTHMNFAVYPSFPYHHIATVEAEGQVRSAKITASVTYDHPEIPEQPTNWVAQQIPPLVMTSLTMEWPVGASGWRIRTGAMRLWGDLVPPDRGDQTQGESQFELRPMFLAAGRLGVDWQRKFGARHGFHLASEGTYDFLQRGGLWRNELGLDWDRSMGGYLRADLLGLTANSQNYENAFIHQYRANSSVSAGLNYVF